MSSFLGFIQLLLVLVPTSTKKHAPALTNKEQPVISRTVLINDTQETDRNWLPTPPLPAKSVAATNDDKFLPVFPQTTHTNEYVNTGEGKQFLTSKPFCTVKLFILFCRLKTDCVLIF
ncbi:MAG: hypothetical protein ACK54Y_12790 [Bacteroidota bacterium]